MRITATQIEQWADTRKAQGFLPVLIRRLVAATVEVIDMRFPGGDSVNDPGWDGFTQVVKGNVWVPGGEARWEVSCRADVTVKANEDFSKRLSEVVPGLAQQGTFVFVTARRWRQKESWKEKMAQTGSWRDVQALDADDLELWLEVPPAVTLWFGELIEVIGNGIESIERFWENWSKQPQWPLTFEALFTGRQPAKESLNEALSSAPSLIVIEADSREEAAAFACAQLLDQGKGARAACLTNADGLRFVDANRGLNTIVAVNPEATRQYVPKDGTTLIVPFSTGDKHAYLADAVNSAAEERRIVLERPKAYVFEETLCRLGEDESEAARLAASTGRSWSVYRRIRAKNPVLRRPVWISDADSRCLVAITLVGAWDDSKLGDRLCLENVSNQPYEDLEAALRYVAGFDDSPILQIGSVWKAKAPVELLYLYGQKITEIELRRFFSVVAAVLTKPDPSLELDRDKRWMASVYGKVREESGIAIEAIADSLAKLRVYAERSDDPNAGVIIAGVDTLVHELLASADGERWLSLAEVFRQLAEAAPDEFLKAIEESLLRLDAPVRRLLSETGESGALGRCWHADLLWALEILAWSPQWLARVACVLVQLAETSIRGGWINTPLNTLISFFRVWWPQTTATPEQRIAVIDVLIRDYGSAAWQLLYGLVPRFPGTITANAKPQWRNDNVGTSRKAVGQISMYYLSEIGSRLIKQAHGNPGRIAQLVDLLDSFDGQYREQVIGLVEAATAFDDDAREAVRVSLGKYLNWHNSFNRDGDRKQRAAADRLRPYFDRLAPKDIIKRHTWLFENNWVELPDGHEDDIYKRGELLNHMRADALREVYTAHGWNGLTDLVETSKNPRLVGWQIAKAEFSDEFLLSWIIERFTTASCIFGESCISGLFAALLPTRRTSLLQNIIRSHASDIGGDAGVAALLANAPFGRDTWNLLEELGSDVRNTYWKNVQFDYVRLKRDLSYTIDHFVAGNRHRTAFQVVGLCLEDVDPYQLMKLLDGIRSGEDPDGPMLDAWRIWQAIEKIQCAGIASRRDLALLEFAFYGLLKFGSKHGPQNLYTEMLNDPALFVECVNLVYLPRNSAQESVDESKRVIAEGAWNVLHDGRGLPGQDSDGSVNQTQFGDWVINVRRIAAEQDRAEITDSIIGEWLSTCPTDSDGKWPCGVVHDLLEQTDAKRIRNGFKSGLINNRGFTSRAYDAGGAQERELAKKYREYALPLQQIYPLVAAMLEEIALFFDSFAQSEDVAARRRLEGL